MLMAVDDKHRTESVKMISVQMETPDAALTVSSSTANGLQSILKFSFQPMISLMNMHERPCSGRNEASGVVDERSATSS